MIRYSWFFFFSSILISIVIGDDYDHVKEMSFKFWLQPGTEECYHELLEKGSSLYFMYEILNAESNDDNIIVYFRDAYKRNNVGISRAPHRGHLEFAANETTLIDICMNQETYDSYAKYMSVFFHVYHVDKILAHIKDVENFDNSSINAHNAIDSITHNIIISREHQIELEMVNQRDVYLIEHNLLWINRWALIHIVIIISCFLFQTYFIRRLFKISKK